MDPASGQNSRKRKRTRFAAAASRVPSDEQARSSRVDAGRPANEPGFAAGPVGDVAPSSYDLSSIPVAPVSTLKINQQAARAKKIKHSLKTLEGDLLETDPSRNAFYDPDIRTDGRTRRPAKRELKFVAEGELTARAEKARHAAERRAADLLFREAMANRTAKLGSLPPLPPLLESALDVSRGGGGVPDVEWWDRPFHCNAHASNGDGTHALEPSVSIRGDRITSYVHHPVSIPSYKPTKQAPVLPLMLTQQERKRLRRQRRLERETEKREMIAVGLLPPPPPKVKLSNLMRVLANESTSDPSKVEADVRAQVAERMRKHEADNEARKKTKEELREKAGAREEKDRENGMYVNVYRILSVENPQHRFKVDVNARQFGLTGTFIVFDNCNLVIVEGGAKALRQYRKLMLRRIDWKESPTNATASGDTGRANCCILVWEGPIMEAVFDGFKSVTLPSAPSVKGFLRRRGMEAHYDAAMAANLREASASGVET